MKLRFSTAIALLAYLGLALAPWPVTGCPRPERFQIPSVPQMAQVDYTGCGAAALAMVFGHWGPNVDYMQIVNVIRSMAHGTSLPDMVRGGHFSQVSSAASEAYPGCRPEHGYPARGLGYGAFFHASRTPWLDQLKEVVAQGYPVVVRARALPPQRTCGLGLALRGLPGGLVPVHRCLGPVWRLSVWSRPGGALEGAHTRSCDRETGLPLLGAGPGRVLLPCSLCHRPGGRLPAVSRKPGQV
jgi:hypothetical protein